MNRPDSSVSTMEAQLVAAMESALRQISTRDGNAQEESEIWEATTHPVSHDPRGTDDGQFRSFRELVKFMTYVPRKKQYKTLVYLQSELEKACFEYGKKNCPEILADFGWNSAEAVELHRWTALFNDRNEFANTEPVDLVFVASIRQFAVERVFISAGTFQHLIHRAVTLLRVLEDEPRVQTLTELRGTMDATLNHLYKVKEDMIIHWIVTMAELEPNRAELDELENEMKSRNRRLESQAGIDIHKAVLLAQSRD